MQYAGVSLCMIGLAVLIYGDYVNNRLETGKVDVYQFFPHV